jgi:hypothetical protein
MEEVRKCKNGCPRKVVDKKNDCGFFIEEEC